ncbi:CHAT domain-containing protein [Streptomyces nigrescens]|uniref:CHAT domain-containing protein n=1 Tax=Streptomyces nigrescens TaxID=1920 RepID=A0ABM7ZSN3_STRNI|nr:CHAT domain-containing protein [Streptomyces nigrescens]BDM69244.1 CHAT domain-containing protein [Streptomyces nigrescens]
MGQRDELLAAVRARVDQVAATGDASVVLAAAARAEAHRLAAIIAGDPLDVEAAHALGRLHHARAQALPEALAGPDVADALRFFTPCFIAGRDDDLPRPLLTALAERAVPAGLDGLAYASETDAGPAFLTSLVALWRRIAEHTPADAPEWPGALANLGTALQRRFEHLGEAADADEAVTAIDAAVRATPDGHPYYPMLLSDLAVALQRRFGCTGVPQDQDAAVETARAAVRATPEDSPHRAMHLHNLTSVLRDRFDRTDAAADLDDAVECGRAAVRAAAAGHPGPASYASTLVQALRARFARTGDLADADEAVEWAREAVRSADSDDPERARCLHELGVVLQQRFERSGERAALDEAVEVARAAVRAAPADPLHRAVHLNNLGIRLQLRYERAGAIADLDEAVEAGREAVRSTPRAHLGRADHLSNLGIALRMRFERGRVPADLDEAVAAGRAAVEGATDAHPHSATHRGNFGVTLLVRVEHTRDATGVGEAVDAVRAGVRGTSDGDPGRPTFLSNLGLALWFRFSRSGALADLDEAVEAGRAAVHALPADHPERARCLHTLCLVLRTRFDWTGQLADLDEAVRAARLAVRLTPDDRIGHARQLAGLGIVLRMRAERTGALGDLEEAVEAGRAAARTLPDAPPDRPDHPDHAVHHAVHHASSDHLAPSPHPDHAAHLTSLALTLQQCFARTGDLAYLDEAVETGRAAARATPDDHPDHALYLNNLGIALRERYEHSGVPADLDEAARLGREAVRATPHDHGHRSAYLANLGNALAMRFDRSGAARDRDEALDAWEQAATMKAGAPWLRVRAARNAAELVAASAPVRAAAFLERAVLMLPEVAPRRLRRGDQQHALGAHAEGLAADAAALALADPEGGTPSERATRALRLSEAGRGVLLAQSLDVRGDLTELTEQHPRLAGRFCALRELLDQDTAVIPAGIGGVRPGGIGAERHRLAGELDDVLRRIRACAGFTTFGLPPGLDELLAEAAHGPVVTLNVSRYRSDAILLTRHGVGSCPLPRLDRDSVLDRVGVFSRALAEATAPDGDRVAAQQTLRRTLEWLWEAAVEPVLSALAAMGEAVPTGEEVPTGEGTPTGQDGRPLPRVWWTPGGPLGLLPLHAAGFHTEPARGPAPRTLMDRVISSYTPTVRALRHARRRQARSADRSRSLIVAMPTTPGQSPLRYVPEEVRRIRPLLPRPVPLTEPPVAHDDVCPPPAAETPTTASVLARLPQCGVAHFACHGASDPADPSQSRLLLHDHATTPLTVSALARVDLDHARLAYLSACSSAAPGGPRLLDEAIHLTSAFQLAGFPHVIGTLWPINDRLAAEIAESFYTHLTTGPRGRLAPDRAAAALHHTLRAVRDRFPATPSLWASYLHAGA